MTTKLTLQEALHIALQAARKADEAQQDAAEFSDAVMPDPCEPGFASYVAMRSLTGLEAIRSLRALWDAQRDVRLLMATQAG